MKIYVFLFILIVCGQILVWNKLLTSKIYCISICAFLIFIAGLRNANLGLNDMKTGYIPGWELVKRNSWIEISRIGMTGKTVLKDLGYAYTTKILSYFFQNNQIFIFVSSVPYLIASTIFIYKYSKIHGISFLLFIGLNYYTSCYYLIHHIWASTFLFIALDFLLKEKKVKFFFFTFLASLFSMSALVFIILFFVYKSKISIYHWLIMASIIIIGVWGRRIVLLILNMLIGEKSRWRHYLNNYSTDDLSRFMLAFICLLCAVVVHKSLIGRDKKNIVFMNMGFLCCYFYALVPIISEFHRFARYYGIVDIILVSNAIYEIKNIQIKRILVLGVTIIFGIYIFTTLLYNVNAAPYFFYWE